MNTTPMENTLLSQDEWFDLPLSETGPDIQEIKVLDYSCGRKSQAHIVLICNISCCVRVY